MLNTFFERPLIHSRISAIVGILVACSLWSLGGPLIKLTTWDPIAVASIRSFIAAGLLIAVYGVPTEPLRRPQFIGGFCYAVAVLLFVWATRHTTAANAVLLQYTAPVWVAILSWHFLKERIDRADWIALALVLAGLILFFFDDISPTSELGNVAAVISGVALAGVMIALRHQRDLRPEGAVLLGNFLAFAFGSYLIASQPYSDFSQFILLLVLGIFQLGLPYVILTRAVRYLTAIEVALLCSIEPILNPIFTFLVIGERPGRYAMIGGTFVIVAVFWRNIAKNRRGPLPA